MDYSLLWKAVIIVIGGTLLLRVAGRKSISQMTLAQVVIMIGLGSLLVQPVVGKNVWATILVGFTLVCTLVALEFIQTKTDFFEKFITGRSKILINNGEIQTQNLKKLRLTVDQLEMALRQQQVSKMSDVQYATLEPNGQVAVLLHQNKQPATKEEIQHLQQEIQSLKQQISNALNMNVVPTYQQTQQPMQPGLTASIHPNNIFEEVANNTHTYEPPDELQ